MALFFKAENILTVGCATALAACHLNGYIFGTHVNFANFSRAKKYTPNLKHYRNAKHQLALSAGLTTHAGEKKLLAERLKTAGR